MPKKKAPEQAVAVDPDVPLRFDFSIPVNDCGQVPDCDINDTPVIFHYQLTKLFGYTCENWKGEKEQDEDAVVFRRSYVRAPPDKRAFVIHECLLIRMGAGELTTARHVLAFEPPYSHESLLGLSDDAPPVFSLSLFYPDASKLAVDVARSRHYLEEMLLACAAAKEPKP